MQLQRTALLLLASAILVSGFGIPSSPLQKPPAFAAKTSRSKTICTRSTKLFGIRCENKYYQLEEMEDKENSTTELFLKEDGTVLIGETDGPLWEEATGYWQVDPGTDDFSMTIVKKFKTGSEGRDMGEFAFEVTRTLEGDMTHVGESVAITGVMKNSDGGEVGFFNMIDGTDDRQDKRSDARPGVDKSLYPTKGDKNDVSATHKGMTVPLGQPSVTLQQQQQQQQGGTLPSGWEEHFDPAQQAYYYVDTSTGISQWERPATGGGFQPQQPTYGGGAQQNAYSYGGGGAAYQQPQQDAYSYGGQATAYQQQPAAATQQTTSSDLPPGWEEHFDLGQQAYYYVETATGVSQWEKPTLQAQPTQQQSSSGLPSGWEEHFDPSQQRNYYVNTQTGTSQWERPQ